MNRVSIGKRILIALQRDKPRSTAEDRSLRSRVEWSAVTVWRHDLSLSIPVSVLALS